MPYRSAPGIRATPRMLIATTALAVLVAATGEPAASAPLPLGVTAEARPSRVTDRVGALFAGDLDGGHFCTASVVRSDDRNLIATAAHCLDDVQNTVFVPGYRDGEAPYGVWRVTGAYVDPAWQTAEDPDADIAFATVAPLDGRQVQDVLGAFPLATAQPDDVTVTVVGYPNARETPLICANTTKKWSSTQREIDCTELSGGTSGSPWLTSSGAVAGVLGGYEGGGTVPEVSYSAVLGDTARALYEEAAVSGG
ncbi:trypsin-like peptidase domain-containing protein [Streptomyces bambusae]|uniref:trypsin-like serine peptidase n=1 Tax=Streptomyces bambusae TaxID=1550616 RepID=UPI001CFDF3F5|nr:trypsin-like peptidase domain-containing protein [Streptomyces bambusae]MCB5166724.1 trypsin-like peptidase domain-containing protein [Streptomyces bambusae]